MESVEGVMMEGEYYLNTRTWKVEKGKQSSWQYRMGPYPTPEAAEHAFEIARERNAVSDQAEKEWRKAWDGDDAPADRGSDDREPKHGDAS